MRSNPFATRFIRPGALEYLFPEGESLAGLIERLRANAWWGQIVGPHGSGKSTLVAALVPALEAAGRSVQWQRVGTESRAGWLRRGGMPTIQWRRLGSAGILIVDGWEQLGWLSRSHIKRTCRHRGAGLIVTAHRDAGLPRLYETQPNADAAWAVVQSLLRQQGLAPLPREVVEAAFVAAGGDIRETLFRLYDLWQAGLTPPS